jgi:acetyl esterase/lipase
MEVSGPKTIIYKTVGKLDIPLDLFLPANATNVPVLLWFHGGGLLQGHRNRYAPHMYYGIAKYNYALISADYRLAPQVGVKDVFEDVQDCIAFIRDPNGLAKHLNNSSAVDASRLAVSGSSAGGYLAFLAGLYVKPKPNVIIAIYPITDPLGTFFTNSQPMAKFDPPGEVDHETRVSTETLAPFLNPKGEAVANNDASGPRQKMYFYMMREAILAELLHFNTGPDRYHDPENDKWRIARALRANGLPPTYVVHGDVDRGVGIEQADEVVGAMLGLGMEVVYKRLKDTDHGFDRDEKVEMKGIYTYMMKHVGL